MSSTLSGAPVVSWREMLLVIALSFYAVAILGSMATMSVGAVILMGAVLITSWGRERLPDLVSHSVSRRLGVLGSLSFLLLFACGLSLVTAWVNPLTFGEFESPVKREWGALITDLSKGYLFFMPIFAIVALNRIPAAMRVHVWRLWITTSLLLFFIGAIQFFSGWPRPQVIPSWPKYFHVTLFMGHHLSVASILIFPYFVFLDVWCRAKSLEEFRISGLAGAILTILGTLVLYGTFSRMLWLSLTVGLALFVWLQIKGKARWITLAAGVALAVSAYQIDAVRTRVQDPLGWATRGHLWKANWEFFKQRPLSGVGWMKNHPLSKQYFKVQAPGERRLVGHSHNMFLELLSGVGLIGLVAWLAWVTFALKLAMNSVYWKGWLAAWTVFLLNGLTQVNFWESKVLHQVMWVVAWSFITPKTKPPEALE